MCHNSLKKIKILLLKHILISTVLSYLNSGSLLSTLNHTFNTLIPKKTNLESVTEFRHISLCNVFYKKISKILANRIKRVFQILFLNIKVFSLKATWLQIIFLWLLKLCTIWKITLQEKSGFMVLKLDMSKAYDIVECFF